MKKQKNALIAIKTSTGLTQRENIENIKMQGPVFESLICTSVMDKLAKIFNNDESLFYKYNNEVYVPVLGMVDDVLCVSRCSNEAVKSVATLNLFMELNKLKLATIFFC